MTNPRIYEKPISISSAWTQVLEWIHSPAAWIPQETENHGKIIRDIIGRTSVQANDIPDIHLVALAIEHGLKICSTDNDFSKYPEVEWLDPLRN